MRVKFHSIWKLVPVPVFTLESMPGRLVGLCLGPIVLVREDYADDWPTIVHELTHCRQFWRGFALLHLLRYYSSRRYRLRSEVEAFRAELAVCDPGERRQRLKDSARALSSSYSLGLDADACLLLLSSRRPFANGSWMRSSGSLPIGDAPTGLPARSSSTRAATPELHFVSRRARRFRD